MNTMPKSSVSSTTKFDHSQYAQANKRQGSKLLLVIMVCPLNSHNLHTHSNIQHILPYTLNFMPGHTTCFSHNSILTANPPGDNQTQLSVGQRPLKPGLDKPQSDHRRADLYTTILTPNPSLQNVLSGLIRVPIHRLTVIN